MQLKLAKWKIFVHFLIPSSRARTVLYVSTVSESIYNKFIMYWSITLLYTLFLSVSLSITFLTLDRFLTLIFPSKYTNLDRNVLAKLNVVGQICLYIVFITFQITQIDWNVNFSDTTSKS